MPHLRKLLPTVALGLVWPALMVGQADTTLYYVIDYMKSTSPEYVDLETEYWQPVHEANIAAGHLERWTLFWVAYGDRTEYDYITVNVVRGAEALTNLGANTDAQIQQVYPDRDNDAEWARTFNARVAVRSELWVPVDRADGSTLSGTHIAVAKMRVAPGGGPEYLALEHDVWRPMQEERIRRGRLTSWGIYQMPLPGGLDYPYNYIAVIGWSEFTMDDDTEAIRTAVHPDVPRSVIDERTMTARDMVGVEVWQKVARAGS